MNTTDAALQRLVGAICGDGESAHLEGLSPQAIIDQETDWFQSLLGEELHEPAFRVWENVQCLVATRQHASKPQFSGACAEMAQSGWPVVVRSSGGTIVPHGPGIVNVSIVHQTPKTDIDEGYRPLINFIEDALNRLNISHTWGARDHSFCDGRYNLLIDERKAAGTAARAKKHQGSVYWLVHGSLMVDCDLQTSIQAISKFEKRLNIFTEYQLDAHINIISKLDRSV